MTEVRLTQAQVDRIIDAAIAHLDIATEEDRRTVRIAIMCATKDTFELGSLLEVFERMGQAVANELKIMGFEMGDQTAQSSAKH